MRSNNHLSSKVIDRIITQRVLNENSGELETKEFKEIRQTTGLIGGFNMIYHTRYEDIMLNVCTGSTSTALFIWITNQFTYMNTDVLLRYNNASKDIDRLSKGKYYQIVKQLVELEYLKKISKGVYRLNPFIYIPYKANGALLQKEWKKITNDFSRYNSNIEI